MNLKILKEKAQELFKECSESKRSKFTIIENLIIDCCMADNIPINENKLNTEKSLTLIVKSTTIMGFKIIPNEMFITDLSESIIEFLIDFRYDGLSWEEIYLAIRINGFSDKKQLSRIEFDYTPMETPHFNIAFLSSCLSSYMNVRNIVQSKIENMINGIMPNQRSF